MHTAVDGTGKGKISCQGTRWNQNSGCRPPKGQYDMRHTLPQEPIQKVRDERNMRNGNSSYHSHNAMAHSKQENELAPPFSGTRAHFKQHRTQIFVSRPLVTCVCVVTSVVTEFERSASSFRISSSTLWYDFFFQYSAVQYSSVRNISTELSRFDMKTKKTCICWSLLSA
jgi:hypothetical protein